MSTWKLLNMWQLLLLFYKKQVKKQVPFGHMDFQGFSFICRRFRPFRISFSPTCPLTRISLWVLFGNSQFLGWWYCDCFENFHFCLVIHLIYFTNTCLGEHSLCRSLSGNAGHRLLSITEMVLPLMELTCGRGTAVQDSEMSLELRELLWKMHTKLWESTQCK